VYICLYILEGGFCASDARDTRVGCCRYLCIFAMFLIRDYDFDRIHSSFRVFRQRISRFKTWLLFTCILYN
jgi:hypothetical protein